MWWNTPGASNRPVLGVPEILSGHCMSVKLSGFLWMSRKPAGDRRTWDHRSAGGTGGEHGFQDGLPELFPFLMQDHRPGPGPRSPPERGHAKDLSGTVALSLSSLLPKQDDMLQTTIVCGRITHGKFVLTAKGLLI